MIPIRSADADRRRVLQSALLRRGGSDGVGAIGHGAPRILREKPCPPRVSRSPADAVASTGLGETERALLHFEDEAYSLLVHGRLVPVHRALLVAEPLVDRNLSTISVGHCVKDQGRLYPPPGELFVAMPLTGGKARRRSLRR